MLKACGCLAGVGTALYGYANPGKISNFIANFQNKDKSNNSRNNNNELPQKQQNPTIILHSDGNNNNKNNSYLIPIGVAVVFGISGYYYYIASSSTKKIIGRVEGTAEETQNLVQETDENNSKRFEILDKKNEDRAQNLEIEIRSEQKAGFTVITEQLYCLQQVAIQTLSAVASLSSGNENGTDNNNNEKLLGYCDKAQEMADTILSDQHILKTKENNLKDIKAEIQLRNNENGNVIFNDYNSTGITPGGPGMNDDNNTNSNPFDLKQNKNNNVIMNVSSSTFNNNNSNGDDNGLVSRIRRKLENGIKPIEIGYYIWNHKEYIVLATGTISVFYITKKVNDFIFNRNNNDNNYKINDMGQQSLNYQVIQ